MSRNSVRGRTLPRAGAGPRAPRSRGSDSSARSPPPARRSHPRRGRGPSNLRSWNRGSNCPSWTSSCWPRRRCKLSSSSSLRSERCTGCRTVSHLEIKIILGEKIRFLFNLYVFFQKHYIFWCSKMCKYEPKYIQLISRQK